jgi:UDP-N-acetylglucosamine 2-epimerase (non-hydrolysing)
MKILTVIGTRPEAIKMAPVIHRLQRTVGIESRVAVSGQHRELLSSVLSTFRVQPDYNLAVMRAGQDLADTTSSILCGMRDILKDFRPERVLVHGDTTTTMAAALAAFYERIPVGHVEAGLRTGRLDSPWPEELNRRFATTIADLHFAPTRQAKRNLLREGVPPGRVQVTGNTVVDALESVLRRIDADRTLRAKIEAQYPFLSTSRKLLLVTVHRRENQGDRLQEILEILRQIAARPDVDIVCPLHPNPKVCAPFRDGLQGIDRVHLVRPLDYIPFVYLMSRSDLILTDSGGIQEEAPILGKPVLLLRETTERPESVAAGTVRIVGTDRSCVVPLVSELLDDSEAYARMISGISVHGDGKASRRIVRALLREAFVHDPHFAASPRKSKLPRKSS